MCTYLNGCLVAFTGVIPAHLQVKPAEITPRKAKRTRKTVSVVAVTAPTVKEKLVKKSEHVDLYVIEEETQHLSFLFPVDKRGDRVNRCNKWNAGRKPRRKDRNGPNAVSTCTSLQRPMKTDEEWSAK